MNSEVSHASVNETRSWDGSGALEGFPEILAENQAARPLATRCLKCFNCFPRGCVILMTDAYMEHVRGAKTGMGFKSKAFTLQPLLTLSWH